MTFIAFSRDILYTDDMESEKIKLRVSRFMSLIIYDDCFSFGFTRANEKPNVGGFVNKLIPSLLSIRKARREKIRSILANGYQRKDAESIYETVNEVIDEVYFDDDELMVIDDSLWIRPNKESKAAFDEIEDSELSITRTDMSSCLRGLLNEYVRFPKYKREQIFFKDFVETLDEAKSENNLVAITYRDRKMKCRVIMRLYDYLAHQDNCVVVYDPSSKRISTLLLCKVNAIAIRTKTQRLSDDETKRIQKYLDDGAYAKDAEKERGER